MQKCRLKKIWIVGEIYKEDMRVASEAIKLKVKFKLSFFTQFSLPDSYA